MAAREDSQTIGHEDRAGETRLQGGIGRVLARISSPALLKRSLYAIYSARLQSRVASGPMPQHIGLVLDGNRRFAARNGYADPAISYRLGTEKIEELLSWCDELEIPIVTLWSLSVDNLEREAEEVASLLDALNMGLPHLRDIQKKARHPRRIKVCGRTELLPPTLQKTIAEVERDTASYEPHLLNIALGYGGREEIVDAVKQLLVHEGGKGHSVQDVAEQLSTQEIGKHLYFNGVPDPDLIIRTSGEIRLGGFMLWESVYAEYYFCDALWPAFRKIDFLRAIRSYQQRRRRYGQ